MVNPNITRTEMKVIGELMKFVCFLGLINGIAVDSLGQTIFYGICSIAIIISKELV